MMRTGILGKESETLIYKETIGNHIATDICALLNTKGGLIVVKRGKTIDCFINSKFAKEKSKILSYITTISRMNTGMYVKINPIIDDKKNWYIVIAVSDLSHIYNDPLTRYYYSINDKFYRRKGTNKITFDVEIERRRLAHINSLKQVRGDYYQIGNYAKGGYFYKYMGLETAFLCIRNSNIQFQEPCRWKDSYERLFYNAIIGGSISSKSNPITYACCLTNKKDNEAAWKIYSYNAIGLNAHCVQFKINRNKFRDQLLMATKGKYDLYEGVVSYKSKSDIDGLCSSNIKYKKKEPELSDLHHIYFDNFNLESYLNLLLLKRDAFMHEQEVRIFLISKAKSKHVKGKCEPIYLKINWSEVLEGVLIDSTCSKLEKKLLEETIFKHGKYGKCISKSLKEKLRPIPYDLYASERKKGRIKINVTPEK